MDYIERMKIELSNLEEKHEKLNARIENSIDSEMEMTLMRKQLYIIKEYIRILKERIDYAEFK